MDTQLSGKDFDISIIIHISMAPGITSRTRNQTQAQPRMEESSLAAHDVHVYFRNSPRQSPAKRFAQNVDLGWAFKGGRLFGGWAEASHLLRNSAMDDAVGGPLGRDWSAVGTSTSRASLWIVDQH